MCYVSNCLLFLIQINEFPWVVAILREANSAEESDCAGTLVDLFFVHFNNYNLSQWKFSGTQKALEVLRYFVSQKKH